ncbi:MAG: flagellar assembly protein A [Bacillota bacterium]
MENLDGTIEIKNAKVIVTDPKGDGRFARIKAGKEVEVYLDSEKITDESIVFSDSKIEIKKIEQAAQKNLNLKFTNNAIQAYLEVQIEPAYELEIKDQPPSNLVVVEAKKKIIECPQLEKTEISAFLLKNKVRFGIKNEVIDQIIEENKSGSYLIAEGQDIKEGKDAVIKSIEKEKGVLAKDFNYITSFLVGEVVVEKIPAIFPKDGINVFKQRIKAPPVKDYQLVAKEGIKLIDDGLKAVALKAGRPKLEKKKDDFEVSIVPQYIINGNVNKKTGNIKFEGDLIINGGIFDYFDVRVGNSLQVKKSITGCKASVDGDVLVKKKIIQSEIIAGLFVPQILLIKIKKLYNLLENLLKSVEQILEIAQQRMGILARNLDFGQILRLLLTGKFKSVAPLVTELAEEMKEFNFEWEAASTLKKLYLEFKGYKKILRIKNTDLFEQLKEELEDVIYSQESLNRSDVLANYIQNSEITASGNVIIMEQGAYNSVIHSGKDIINIKGKGFIKGGKYFAREWIYLKEVGSALNITEFYIGQGIYIKNTEGNIKINAPNDLVFIDQPSSNIFLKVNKSGKLIQKAGSPDIKKLKKMSNYREIPVVKN